MQSVQKRHARIERHKRRRALYKAADIRMGGSDWRYIMTHGQPKLWAQAFASHKEEKARIIIAEVPVPRTTKRPPTALKMFADGIMRRIGL